KNFLRVSGDLHFLSGIGMAYGAGAGVSRQVSPQFEYGVHASFLKAGGREGLYYPVKLHFNFVPSIVAWKYEPYLFAEPGVGLYTSDRQVSPTLRYAERGGFAFSAGIGLGNLYPGKTFVNIGFSTVSFTRSEFTAIPGGESLADTRFRYRGAMVRMGVRF
ncbi:MAG TPA: hypothetical protein VFZ78_10915, partial [Flavisolibacter sp.]